MPATAHLVLEDGTVFRGTSAGAPDSGFGEVVFNTSMTGYQEILTDPSYAGQIVVMTYPLIGNYGVSDDDVESARIQAAGFVIREECPEPSHWRSTGGLKDYLVAARIPCVAGVDTRALTRRLRSGGVLMGAIGVDVPADETLAKLRASPRYGNLDLVHRVTSPARYEWLTSGETRGRIAILDTGLKFNIARVLAARGYQAVVLPCDTGAEDVLATGALGVVLSPGPGDPAHLDNLAGTARTLVQRLPVMGICLGHQVLGRAFGARTYKLKFGHHGANHPVQDLATGAVHITTQNHGYAIDPDGLKDGAEPSHVNLNDGTCEGLRHRDLPVVSIQYHSEAGPGPHDNEYLFDRFLELVEQHHR
ncbi:MAG TPA: glutamine-hydrolyzing carbamoyl-phosphate synthase small subunit [Dehalococcoidia bacterium]|nr:glutamine-hydrolyzing carbamoyl-phosphate synthase small subunit [Dehalococcoidia bacterium]